MQAIHKQGGNTIDYTPAAAKSAGDVFVDNGKVLIFTHAVDASALAAPYIDGVFDIVKDSSNLSSAFTAVYWDDNGDPYGGTAGTGCLTSTSSGNTFVGYCIETAGATDGLVRTLVVNLPSTVTVAGSLTTAITDPGASGAIPVTKSGYVPIVTAGAETRTLAAPSFIGQELLIYMKTDGGDCVITCSTTLNEAGNNTITLADTGDAIRMVAVEEGSNKRWRISSVDGHSLSTV
jgi:predicted RecA/RadA family phage recombinase